MNKMVKDKLPAVFSIKDTTFHQVQQQLNNTECFHINWLDGNNQVNDQHFSQCVKVEFLNQNSQLAKGELSDEPKNNHQFSLVLFNNLTWQRLFEFEALCNENQVQLLFARLIKPTDSLSGAIRFTLSSAISRQVQSILTQWAENIDIELCYLHNPPTINQPGLLVMDMDSTAIEIECIDEIAKLAGVGEQVAQVTASAMRGELDFAQSLHARVATLTDAPVAIIDQVANNLPLMPGLESLVSYLQRFGWKLVIASGGFTYMTDVLKDKLNLDLTVANQLQMVDGKLTGKVLGEIVDAKVKAETVISVAKQFAIKPNQTVAMGDGANDLMMMEAAQLGVAFHAKPLVREQADVSVQFGGLDQLLYLLD